MYVLGADFPELLNGLYKLCFSYLWYEHVSMSKPGNTAIPVTFYKSK